MRMSHQLLPVLQFQGSLMLSDAIAYIVINFLDEGRNEITVSFFPEQNFIQFHIK